VRENAQPTPAFNNCSGKHSGFLSTAVALWRADQGYIKYDHPVQRRLRAVMSDLCGSNADDFRYGTDGCGIPTLATPLKLLARAMASMAEPSRLSNKHAEAATRIRARSDAEPFMMAGTGRFCTRSTERCRRGADQDRRRRACSAACCRPSGLGIALKMWDGADGRAEVANGYPAWPSRRAPADGGRELLHPPVKNVVGLLGRRMRRPKSWLG
jgi:L-asparaginase II